MTDQHSFVSADHFDRDLYTSSQTGERVLNAAIVQVPSPASRNGPEAIHEGQQAHLTLQLLVEVPMCGGPGVRA